MRYACKYCGAHRNQQHGDLCKQNHPNNDSNDFIVIKQMVEEELFAYNHKERTKNVLKKVIEYLKTI